MDMIQQIKIFKKIVEVGSFSEAARELGLSLSLISRQIEDLEEKIKTRLLHRTTRRTTPTELGEIYYQRTQHILQEVEDVHQLLLDYKTEPQGTIKIAVSHLLGQFYLAELIPKFLAQHPKIQIKLELSDALVDIVGSGIDIAIRTGHMQDSSLSSVKLRTQKTILCASKLYLKKNGVPKSPKDIQNHKCVLLSEGNSYSPWYLRRKNKSPERLNLSGHIYVNQGLIYTDFIKLGLGLGLIFSWVIEKEIQSGELVQILPQFDISFDPIAEDDIYLLFPRGQFLSTKVRAFIDFVKEQEKKNNPSQKTK